jgi:hypothetical protein
LKLKVKLRVTIIEISHITFLIALFCREFVTEFLNYQDFFLIFNCFQKK